MQYSIVQKSQLEGALRLDAEYYQPEYLELNSKLKSQKSKSISELVSDIRYGLYVEPEYLEKGVNFIRALNLLNFWIDGEILKIDERKVPPAYRLKAGDVLIVRSGANTGCVGLVYPRFEGATFGSYTIRLRFNKINPFFAAIFLNTKYGLLQTQRLQTGMAQPNLNIPNIKEIKIPLFSERIQNEIEKICLEIEKEREKSENFYSQAENLLLEELGLKDFKIEDELSYIVNLSKIKSAHRADAEYFQPKYDKIEKILSKFKQQRLEDVSSLISYGTVPTSPYVEDGVPYVKGENLRNCFIDYSKLVYLDRESTRKLPKKFYLKEGDIIISQMGTVGQAGLVTKDEDGWLFASFTIRVRLKDEVKSILDPLFVTLYIQNISRPYYLLRRIAQASVRQNTDLPTIKDLRIPILPKPTQQKIANLVQKSHEARKKAKQLLEEAKRKVEELIKK